MSERLRRIIAVALITLLVAGLVGVVALGVTGNDGSGDSRVATAAPTTTTTLTPADPADDPIHLVAKKEQYDREVRFIAAMNEKRWYEELERQEEIRVEAERVEAERIAAAEEARRLEEERIAAQTPTTEPYVAPVYTPPAPPSASYGSGACGGDLPPCYVMMRESGGNITAQNPTSTASGKWQFLDSTWGGYGGYAKARYAPESVQDARARELWAGGAGCSHWSAC